MQLLPPMARVGRVESFGTFTSVQMQDRKLVYLVAATLQLPSKTKYILFDIARPRERQVKTLSFFWLQED